MQSTGRRADPRPTCIYMRRSVSADSTHCYLTSVHAAAEQQQHRPGLVAHRSSTKVLVVGPDNLCVYGVSVRVCGQPSTPPSSRPTRNGNSRRFLQRTRCPSCDHVL